MLAEYDQDQVAQLIQCFRNFPEFDKDLRENDLFQKFSLQNSVVQLYNLFQLLSSQPLSNKILPSILETLLHLFDLVKDHKPTLIGWIKVYEITPTNDPVTLRRFLLQIVARIAYVAKYQSLKGIAE